jgi:hypothetical protein
MQSLQYAVVPLQMQSTVKDDGVATTKYVPVTEEQRNGIKLKWIEEEV